MLQKRKGEKEKVVQMKRCLPGPAFRAKHRWGEHGLAVPIRNLGSTFFLDHQSFWADFVMSWLERGKAVARDADILQD